MPPKDELTAGELEVVTKVFRQFETGLREACICAKVTAINIMTVVLLAVGPSALPGGAGAEPPGAGGGGHDQLCGQAGAHLLPSVLQARPQQVQGGGRGAVQPGDVQGGQARDSHTLVIHHVCRCCVGRNHFLNSTEPRDTSWLRTLYKG